MSREIARFSLEPMARVADGSGVKGNPAPDKQPINMNISKILSTAAKARARWFISRRQPAVSWYSAARLVIPVCRHVI